MAGTSTHYSFRMLLKAGRAVSLPFLKKCSQTQDMRKLINKMKLPCLRKTKSIWNCHLYLSAKWRLLVQATTMDFTLEM